MGQWTPPSDAVEATNEENKGWTPPSDSEEEVKKKESETGTGEPTITVEESDLEAPSTYEDYNKKAVDIRPFKRQNNPEDPTDVSTVKMRTETFDGENWVSFPTIFPKEGNEGSSDPSDWIDYGEDAKAAYDEAVKRGEVFEFGTDKEAALKFGEGSWKPTEQKPVDPYSFEALMKGDPKENVNQGAESVEQKAEEAKQQFDQTGDVDAASEYGYVTPEAKTSSTTSIITEDTGAPVVDKTIIKEEEDLYKNPYAELQKPLYGRAPGETSIIFDFNELEEQEKKLEELKAKRLYNVQRNLGVTDQMRKEQSELEKEVYKKREIKRDIEDQVNRDILDLSKNKTKEISSRINSMESDLYKKQEDFKLKEKELIDSGKLKKDEKGDYIFETQEDLDAYQSEIDDYKVGLADYENERRNYEIASNISSSADLSKIKKETVDEFTGIVNSLRRGWDRGATVSEIMENDIWGMSKEEMAKNIALRNAQAKGLLSSEAMERFNRAEDVGEALEVFKQDPIEVGLQLFTESMSQLISSGRKIIPTAVGVGIVSGAVYGSAVPGVGTGAGALTGLSKGLTVGMATSGFAMEYFGAVMDEMEKAGYDVTDPKQVEAGLNDEELISKARKVGASRGIPIAIVDLFTGNMAGRIFNVGKIGLTKAQRAARLTGDFAFQTGGEMGGELAAQASAGFVTGEDHFDAKGVLAEGLGGWGSSVPNLAVNIAADKANRVGDVSDFAFGDEASRFNAMKNNDFDAKAIYGKLDLALSKNQITEAKAEEVKRKVDNDIKIMESIPDNITSDKNKEKAFELLSEKSELGKKDKSLVGTRVDEINEELTKIAESEKDVKEPTLKMNTTPSDSDYGTVNRHDGKGPIKLTKEEYEAEQAKLKDEEVPTEAPAKEGEQEVAETTEPTAETEPTVTEEPVKPTEPSVEVDQYIEDKAVSTRIEVSKAGEVDARMNNAEEINETDLNEAAEDLYSIHDEIEAREDLSPESKRLMQEKVENLISKVEGYEFKTTDEVSEADKRTAVTGVKRVVRPKEKQHIKTPIERAVGREVKSEVEGQTSVLEQTEEGYTVSNYKDGEKISETKLKDKPVYKESVLDEDGNLSSVVMEDSEGNTVEITDSELALDIAIEHKENTLGPVEDVVMERVISEVVEKTKPKQVETKPVTLDAKERERVATRTQRKAKEEGIIKEPSKEPQEKRGLSKEYNVEEKDFGPQKTRIYKDSEGNQVAGTIFKKKENGDIEISSVSVEEDYRRKGIAEKIYKELQEEAQAKGGTLYSVGDFMYSAKDKDGKKIAPARKLWEKLIDQGLAKKVRETISGAPRTVYRMKAEERVERKVKGPKREAKKEKPVEELTKKELERELKKAEKELPAPLKKALDSVREKISGTKNDIEGLLKEKEAGKRIEELDKKIAEKQKELAKFEKELDTQEKEAVKEVKKTKKQAKAEEVMQAEKEKVESATEESKKEFAASELTNPDRRASIPSQIEKTENAIEKLSFGDDSGKARENIGKLKEKVGKLRDLLGKDSKEVKDAEAKLENLQKKLAVAKKKFKEAKDSEPKFSKRGQELKEKYGIIETKEETANETEAIVEKMNDMEVKNASISLTDNTTKEKTDVDGLNNNLDSNLETIDISDYDGIPMNFTISDQLASGEVTNPNTGNVISRLFGGLGFNGTKGNTKNGWANTTEAKAQEMLNNAVNLYESNKELFEKLWDEGRLPKGQIPVAVVKMGADGIKSNEALFRAAADNIKSKIPVKNQKKAFKEFVKSVNEKIKANEKMAKTGIGPKGPLKDGGKSKAVAAKKYKDVAKYIKDNNITDIVSLLENVDKLSIGRRAIISSEIFSGDFSDKSGTEAGAPGKATGKALIEGMPNSARNLVSFKKLGEIIEEKSMSKVPHQHVISLVGVDVLNPQVTEPNHPNYPYGVKGGSIGVLGQPVHMADVFGEAYSSVVAKTAVAEKKGVETTVGTVKNEGVPVGMGLGNLAFRGATVSTKMTAVDKLNGFFRQAFPNVQFFNNQAAFDSAMQDPSVKQYLKEGDVVYGITQDGKVYINPKIGTTKTALHEVGHIWMDHMKNTKEGKAIYEKGLSLVEGTKEFELAKAEYGDTKLAREEALMELMSSKGDTIINAAQKSKFKEWLLTAWKYIADNFESLRGMSPKKIENLTLDKFVEGMLADVMSGEAVTKEVVKDKSKISKFQKFKDRMMSKPGAKGFVKPKTVTKEQYIEQNLNNAMEFDPSWKGQENFLRSQFGKEWESKQPKFNKTNAKDVAQNYLDEVSQDGLWETRGFGLDEIAQEIVNMGIPVAEAEAMVLQAYDEYSSSIPVQNKTHYTARQTMKERIKSFRKGYKKGGKDRENALNEIRGFIEKYAKEVLPESGITRGQIGPILKDLASATKESQIEDALVKIDFIANEVNSKQELEKLDKVLNGKYTKTVNGNLVGTRISKEKKDRLDNIKEDASNYSISELEQKSLDIENKAIEEGRALTNSELDQIVDYNTAIDLKEVAESMEAIKNIKHKKPINTKRGKNAEYDHMFESLEKAINNLTALVAEGRQEFKDKKAASHANIMSQVQDTKEAMSGGETIVSEGFAGTTKQKTRSQEFIRWIADAPSKMFNRLEGWKGLIKHLDRSKETGGSKRIEEIFIKPIREARRKKEQIVQKWFSSVNDKKREIFGEESRLLGFTALFNPSLKSSKKANKVFDFGTYKLSDGTVWNANNVTMDNVMNWYSMLKNESVKDKLINNNKFTPEIIESINDMMDNPENAKFKEYADWVVEELYQKTGDDVNDAYVELYGVNMPREEFYVPIKAAENTGGEITVDKDGNSTIQRASANSKHTVRRVNHNKEIDLSVGLEQNMFRYMNEMSHMVSHGKAVRDIGRVISNPGVRNTIKQVSSKDALNLLNRHLVDIANDASQKNMVTSGILKWKNRGVTASLALNLPSAMTQLASFPAYASFTNSGRWAAEFAGMALNPVSLARDFQEISNLPYMKERYGKGFDRDMAAEMAKDAQTAFSGTSTMASKLMFLTKWGDKAAIMLGGIPYYRAQKKIHSKKMSPAKAKETALNDFINATDEVQQSSYVENLSAFQRDKGGGNFLTSFMSSAIMYNQQMRDSWRNIARGRASAKDVKRLLMYGVTMPALFTLAKGGLDFEEDDLEDAVMNIIKANLMMQGAPVVTVAADYAINKIQKRPFSFSSMAVGGGGKTARVIEKGIPMLIEDYQKGEIQDPEKFIEEILLPTFEMIGPARGIPLKNIKKLTWDNYKRATGEKEFKDFRNWTGMNIHKTSDFMEEEKGNQKGFLKGEFKVKGSGSFFPKSSKSSSRGRSGGRSAGR